VCVFIMWATNRTEAMVNKSCATLCVVIYVDRGSRGTFVELIGRVERPVSLVECFRMEKGMR